MMGASNVAAAFSRWRSSLDAAPFTVLAYMALTSLDRDTQPSYYGGAEAIAEIALGKPRQPDGTVSSSDLRTVKRHVRTLVDAGAIVLVNSPRVGDRAVYNLRLGLSEGDVERHPEGDVERHPEGDVLWQSRGTYNVPPRRTTGTTTGTRQDESVVVVPFVQDARDRTRDAINRRHQ